MQTNRAFTLLELLVTTAVTALLMLGVSSLFIAFLNTSHKSKISQTLREEGGNAMRQITAQLRSAKGVSVNCSSSDPQNQITFSNEFGQEISYFEDQDRLASASAATTYHLTSSRANETDYLQNLSFRCFNFTQEQKYIEISFSLNVTKVRPTSLEFRSGVVTRN
jgi:prepilin-type N-terminal cleavage/methylation domain-containing protein